MQNSADRPSWCKKGLTPLVPGRSCLQLSVLLCKIRAITGDVKDPTPKSSCDVDQATKCGLRVPMWLNTRVVSMTTGLPCHGVALSDEVLCLP
jgi:hypothetical protein